MKRLLLVSALLLTAACGAPSLTPQSHVRVDSPQLRALKAGAGIADCPGTTAGDTTKGAKGIKALPRATLPCLGGGKAINLRNLRGPLVINLWAQWCGPCRKELPIYQQFHTQGKVPVLGIDWNDTQPALALQLAKDKGVRFPLAADTEPAIKGQFLPRLLMIDADGAIVYDQAIQIHSLAQLQSLVATHLEAS